MEISSRFWLVEQKFDLKGLVAFQRRKPTARVRPIAAVSRPSRARQLEIHVARSFRAVVLAARTVVEGVED
jgi:hypothetical protein